MFSFLLHMTGKITIKVDWFNVLSKPAIVTVEDVYALAGPIIDRKYDKAREEALETALKEKVLRQLERSQGNAIHLLGCTLVIFLLTFNGIGYLHCNTIYET